jgi:uncharacterized protein (DUF58 family)
MQESLKYLDPNTLTKLSRIDIIARLVVEGFISGLHKSPYRGFSVEFAEHREYAPGDDLKHLDWKVFGRTDRFYIKQYEEETNLRSNILLDTSESMVYKGAGPLTKLEYGCYVAASLAYMLLQQQDAVGLATFDSEIRRFVPAKSSPAHLRLLLHELNVAAGQRKTNLDTLFHDLAERVQRRGMIVVISDLFYDVDKTLLGLRHFRHRGHEVIVFNVVARDELEFGFTNMTLFEGLEDWGELLVNPKVIRKAYRQEVREFARRLRSGCLRNQIDFVQITTDTKLDVALSAYLAARMKRKPTRT